MASRTKKVKQLRDYDTVNAEQNEVGLQLDKLETEKADFVNVLEMFLDGLIGVLEKHADSFKAEALRPLNKQIAQLEKKFEALDIELDAIEERENGLAEG